MNLPKMNRFATGILMSLIAAFLFQCQEPHQIVEKKFSAIQPPFPDLTKPFIEFKLDASKGGTIRTVSGTRFTIPPLALTDTGQNAFTDEVTIKYREYHDAVDVFLSGIPMEYSSEDQKRIMETAGMFELRAEAEGRELQLRKGKAIQINFASQEAGTNYNFFKFDETEGEWEFSDYSKPEPNPARDSISEYIDQMKPARLIPFTDDQFALNYMAFLDVWFNNNYSKIYNNKNNPAIRAKVQEYGLQAYDIKGGVVSYKGRSYPAGLLVWKPVSGKPVPAWTAGHYCTTEKVRGNTYRFRITHPKTKKEFSMTAESVMLLTELFSATSEKWKKEYEEYQRKLEAAKQRLALEAEVFRKAELMGFGIYNYDKFSRTENTIALKTHCSYDTVFADSSKALQWVYCFIGDQKTVIKIPALHAGKLFLDPNEKNVRMLAILSDNTLGLFTKDSYRKIDMKALRNSPEPEYTFYLQSKAMRMESDEDVRDLLGM